MISPLTRARMRTCGVVLLVLLLSACDFRDPAAEAAKAAREQAARDQRVFDNAFAAYKRGEHAAALAGFQAIAARDPTAKFNLGVMIQKGEGTSVNKARAFRLFCEAADAGNGNAAVGAGFMQIAGDGTAADPEAGATRVRSAMTDPELRETIRSRMANVCQTSDAQLRELPSLFDMVKRHMPGKAALCTFMAATSDPSERIRYGECVQAMCEAEEGFGETNSCDAMQRESRQVEAQRALLKRTLTALECPP